MPVTPQAADNSIITTAGTAVQVFAAGLVGGLIQNPLSTTDQGVSPAEGLYVDPVGIPGGAPGLGNGTTFVLQPGEKWSAIPGQTTPTRANAATSGHKFSAVSWR